MKEVKSKKMVSKGTEKRMEAPSVGKPEQELKIENPVKVPAGKSQPGFVRMKVFRAFQLSHNGVEFSGKEGDTVDVPEEIAQELEYGFKTNYQHVGMINTTNAKRHTVQRATRI